MPILDFATPPSTTGAGRSVAAMLQTVPGALLADAYVRVRRAVNQAATRWSAAAAAILVLILSSVAMAPAAAGITLVALGDSLTAGYGLAPEDAFPVRLEARLREAGYDVEVINAGVSGDTSAGGLARLDWSVPPETDGVIVELGANDALRGIEPVRTAENLDRLLASLAERDIPVLLAGMLAPRNLGSEYAQTFDPIYPRLADRHDAVLYPFFLDGVAAEPALNQRDGIHPNAEGVARIVDGILPAVEKLIERINAGRAD